MNKNNFTTAICLLILFSMCSAFQHGALAQNKKPASTTTSVAPKYRPRVVYFYTNWCGVCQRFGPTLKNTVAAYSKYIDFQQFNVDDQKNRTISQHFRIHSIPATFIYNSKGQLVFSKTGAVDQQSLYNILRSLYMEAEPKPAKIDTAKHNKKAHAITKF